MKVFFSVCPHLLSFIFDFLRPCCCCVGFFFATKAFCLSSHVKSLVAERNVGETWLHLSKGPLWSESLWASLFVICVETVCLLLLASSDSEALSSLMMQMCPHVSGRVGIPDLPHINLLKGTDLILCVFSSQEYCVI